MEIKDRVREKAKELFHIYGIRSVTMDEIANQLGVSKKTIYQSFSDKSELVDEITVDMLDCNKQSCVCCRQEAKDAVHEILLAIDAVKAITDQMNPSLLFDLERGYPNSYKRFLNFMQDYLFGIIVDNLKWGKKDGLFREDINEEIYARARLEMIPFPFNERIFPKSKYTLAKVMETLHELYLYSIVTPKGLKLIEKYSKEKQTKTSNPKQ